MKARSSMLLAAVVLAATLAAGCGGSSKSSSGTTTATTSSASNGAGKTYTVGIDIPFYPMYDYISAKNSQFFGNKPYKVVFKVLDATTQVPAFGAGQLDVMTTTPSFMPRVMEQYHTKIQFFFPLARWTVGPQILVPVNSPYKTLDDLKGKTLAIAPLKTRFGAEEAAIEAATGQNIRTYFKLTQTDAAAQQLALHRVDAAFLEAPATYPLLQGGKFKAIYSVHDAFLKAFGDPGVMNGGFQARTDFIKKNPQFVHDLIAAFQKAWDLYQKNPHAVNSVASKQSGIPEANLAIVGKVLDLSTMPKSMRRVRTQDVQTWVKMFALLKKSGFIQTVPADIPSMFVVTK